MRVFARTVLACAARRLSRLPRGSWEVERGRLLGTSSVDRSNRVDEDDAPARRCFWLAYHLLQSDGVHGLDDAHVCRLLEAVADVAVEAGEAELAAEAALLALKAAPLAELDACARKALRYSDNANDAVLAAQIRLIAWRRLVPSEDELGSSWANLLLERAAVADKRLPAPDQLAPHAPDALSHLLGDVALLGGIARLRLGKAWVHVANRILFRSPSSPKAFMNCLIADGVIALERERASRRRSAAVLGGRSPEAEWARRVIHHADLSGVLPGGRTFDNEDADELRLVVMHELTHAWSLLGTTGAWLAQGREMLAQFRSVMHVHERALAGEASSAPLSRAAQQLESDDESVLVCALVCANVASRVQAAEAMLIPWMEGVAMFGETAVDPRMEPDSAAPPIAAMQHLDPGPGGMRQLPGRLARYGASLDRIALQRLELYAGLRGAPYMAGYLAVRSIVSRWRDICGPVLSNERALIVLTEATRFGFEPFLPHPMLQLEDFKRALCVGLRAFCDMCLGLTRKQLLEISEPGDENSGDIHFLWGRAGPERLHRSEIDPDASEAAFMSWYRAWNDIGIIPLPNDTAPPELAKWARDQFSMLRYPIGSPALRTHIRTLIRQRRDQTIVRLSAADVLFWLDPQRSALWLLAPVSATRASTLSMELVRYHLSADSATRLADEIARCERPRLRVVTFADMLRRDHGTASLPAGRIYRGLCYGQWSDVRFSGDLGHLEDESDYLGPGWEDVRRQVHEAWVVAVLDEEAYEVALAGKAEPGRMLGAIDAWISSRKRWTLDGVPVAAGNLANHVLGLTRQDIAMHLRAGAEAILPDGLSSEASGLIRRGLDHVAGDVPGAFDALVRTMDATARRTRLRLPSGVRHYGVIGRMFVWRKGRWDVR